LVSGTRRGIRRRFEAKQRPAILPGKKVPSSQEQRKYSGRSANRFYNSEERKEAVGFWPGGGIPCPKDRVMTASPRKLYSITRGEKSAASNKSAQVLIRKTGSRDEKREKKKRIRQLKKYLSLSVRRKKKKRMVIGIGRYAGGGFMRQLKRGPFEIAKEEEEVPYAEEGSRESNAGKGVFFWKGEKEAHSYPRVSSGNKEFTKKNCTNPERSYNVVGRRGRKSGGET